MTRLDIPTLTFLKRGEIQFSKVLIERVCESYMPLYVHQLYVRVRFPTILSTLELIFSIDNTHATSTVNLIRRSQISFRKILCYREQIQFNTPYKVSFKSNCKKEARWVVDL